MYQQNHLIPKQRAFVCQQNHLIPEQRAFVYQQNHLIPKQRAFVYQQNHLISEQRAFVWKQLLKNITKNSSERVPRLNSNRIINFISLSDTSKEIDLLFASFKVEFKSRI